MIDGVTQALDPIAQWQSGAPDPSDRPPLTRESSGVAIAVTKSGVTAKLLARDAVEWSLLEEHLKGDPLWKTAKALEGAIAGVIRSSRELYAFTWETLKDVSGMPIRSQLGTEPAITDHVVRGVYREVSARMRGKTSPVLQLSEIEAGAGGAMEFWALRPALIAPPLLSKQKIVTCLTETVQRVTNNDLAADLARDEKRADDLGAKLLAYANDLRLLRYLPGTCRICRRYEVR